MNDIVWLPSVLVLGIGLAIGLAVGVVVRRGRKRSAGKSGSELRRRDLESRRDELYRRLRSPDLNPGDRESLELAAAYTLRELDRLSPAGAASRPTTERPIEAAAEDASAGLPPARGGKHPALVGFVAGMAVVVLIGSLVYLAVRDSGAGGMTAPAGGGGTAEQPHPEASSLPADVRRNLEQLEAAAAAAPNDLLARKRLALARLDAGLYFEAFSDAEAILASRPEDPDGLFIQGVVSLSMGRAAESLELLDRVLVRYPQHLQAMIYRGLALARTSEMGQATATWEMALEMAGGSHPDIEMLLEQARSQPPPMATPPPAPAATPPPTSAPAATAVDSASSYRVTVELAPGRTAPPSTVLFVFLRPGESGPPVAVKRIPAPRLPIELVLSSEDAMMGAASLPAEGFLVARLSTTGNVSARSPDDLETSASAAIGQSVTLTLGGS